MLINTSQLHDHVGDSISIQGRLVGLEQCLAKNGHSYFRLKLVDSAGAIKAYVWPEASLYDFIETINVSEQHLVELNGRVTHLNGCHFLKLSELYVVSASHVRNGAALLPLPLVPVRAREALDWLINFIDELSNEPLRAFLTGILMDPTIGHRFIRCRASASYHSAYPGGLLVHSVQVAQLAGSWAVMLGESELFIALTQVGALLHDLGKIDTVGEKNPRPMNPSLYQHEIQTVHLLAPHISRLIADARIEGMVISHLIGRLASTKHYREQSMIEELIRFADQASAGHQQKQSLEQLIKLLPQQSSNDDSFYNRFCV